MNSFENTVYTILDACIFSDAGLMVFLWGGFAFCFIFAGLLLLPWFRTVPYRFFVAAGTALPVVVLIYASIFNLLINGRTLGIMLALSPIVLALIPSLISLIVAITRKSMPRRFLSIIMLACIIISQLWSILVIWLATNYGFMGASC